jgi:signal peptidase I
MRKMFKLLFWIALVLGVVIGILRLTAIRWWRVPTDDPYLTASISPSVRGGDLILLWRLTKPRFGDLVLCPEPKEAGRVVIGRLVGEANDVLTVTGGDITVNRKHQTTDGDCYPGKFSENDPGTGIEVEQTCSMEQLGSSEHPRGNPNGSPIHAAEVSTTVPQDQVWLVSDNRLFPYDSRDYGPVPRETCTEIVFFRLVGVGGFFDTSTRNQYIH